jgi:hypothetical protein
MMTRAWTGTAAADGATVIIPNRSGSTYTLKDGDIRDYTRFVLRARTGQVRVFASVDGTNFPASPLVLSLEPAVDGSDNVTEPQGTFVAATSGTRLHYFFGTYKAIKILQKGATAAAVDLFASER